LSANNAHLYYRIQCINQHMHLIKYHKIHSIKLNSLQVLQQSVSAPACPLLGVYEHKGLISVVEYRRVILCIRRFPQDGTPLTKQTRVTFFINCAV
jgi:hypothetical protein